MAVRPLLACLCLVLVSSELDSDFGFWGAEKVDLAPSRILMGASGGGAMMARTWTVTVRNLTYEVSNGTSLASGTLAVSQSTATLGPYSWSLAPLKEAAGISQPNSTFNTIATGVIQQVLANHKPFLSYWLDAGTGYAVSPIVCGPVVLDSASPVTCSNNAIQISIGATAGADPQYMTATVSVTGPTTADSAAVTLALHRMQTLGAARRASLAMAASNKARIKQARTFVAILYFLCALLMLGVVFITSTLLAWKFPGRRPFFRMTAIGWWMFLVAAFVFLISMAAGAMGWLVSGSIVGVSAIVLGAVYYRSSRGASYGGGDADKQAGAAEEGKSVELAVVGGGDGGAAAAGAGDIGNGGDDDGSCISRYFGGQDDEPNAQARRKKYLIAGNCSVFLSLLLILIVVFSWQPMEYQVYDRISGSVVGEYIVPSVDRVNLMTYAYNGVANHPLIINTFNTALTKECGVKYNAQLGSDAVKKADIDVAFIQKYNINMTLYLRQSYTQYNTVNDWFTRRINPIYRPIAAPTDDNVIVSPADARVVAFQHLRGDSIFWIKSATFNVSTLIGRAKYGPAFEGGAMMIVRLAPQDYHRFHAPVSGTVIATWRVAGRIHSVNQAAMTSDNEAIYNERRVSIIATKKYGNVAFISIGAVCVGSITLAQKAGDVVTKGQEMGYYAFGGSTNVMIFPSGTMQYNEDILYRSRQQMETIVQQGMEIGNAI